MNKRHKKQRRRFLIGLIVIAVVMVVGFAGYLFLQRDTGEGGMDVSAISGIKDKVESVVSNEGKSASSDSSNDSYESIVSGTGKLSFSYYMKNLYTDNEFQSYNDEFFKKLSKEEYTLSELIEEMNSIFDNPENYYVEGHVQSVRYAYLDCGNDGVKEMALEFVCPIVEPESSLNLILKEIDGKVQVVYSYCNWSRSTTDINQYGFISGGGSNGASNHGYDCGIINADGSYSYGYYEEEEYDISMFAYRYGVENLDDTALDGNIVVYSLQTEKSTADSMAPIVYSYVVYNDNFEEIKDIPNLYTDSEYKKLIDTIPDAEFIPYDEFEARINKKLESIGATQDVIGSNQLQYNEIKQ